MSIVYVNELREILIKFVLLLSISVVIIALLFMNLDSGNNAVTSLDSWGSIGCFFLPAAHINAYKYVYVYIKYIYK